jgi:hypothetical protein
VNVAVIQLEFMTNPYSSPSKLPHGTHSVLTLREQMAFWLTAPFLLATFVAFCLAAVFLIFPVLGEPADSPKLPSRLQNAVDPSVWILGIASLLFASVTIVAFMLAYRQRMLIAWALTSACILIFAAMFVLL